MPISVVPLVTFDSRENRDKFLGLLKDVSQVTQTEEANCISYAWFIENADDKNPTPGKPRIRGVEVYASEDDLAVTHRSSAPYKEFRRSAVADNLVAPPAYDLTFRVPAGIGFLSQGNNTEAVTAPETFVVTSEYSVKDEKDSAVLLQDFQLIAEELKSEKRVLSYFVMKWQEPKAEAQLFVFERYASKEVWESIQNKSNVKRLHADSADIEIETTTWVGGGVGFIRGGRL